MRMAQNRKTGKNKQNKTHLNPTKREKDPPGQSANGTKRVIDSNYSCLLFSDIGQEVNRWI
jgi:hypothetical protein